MEGMTQPNPNPPLNDSAREWGKDVNRAIAELQSGQDTNSGNLDTVMYTAEVAIDVANATQENIEQVIIPSIEAPLAVPAPPTGLNLVSARTGWTETGNPIGEATIGWNAVTQDVNSNALRIVGYEVLTGTAGGVLIARNLNPNPSFETGGSTFTVATNLATNPGFETPSGTVVVRTNYATDPRAVGAGWAHSSGGGVASRSAEVAGGPLASVPTWQKMTWSVAPVSAGFVLSNEGATVNLVTAGVTYTVSTFVLASWATSLRPTLEWVDASGAVIGTTVLGAAVALAAGVWVRVSQVAVVAPAGAVRAKLQARGAGSLPGAGGYIGMSALLIDDSPLVRGYFDGNSPAEGDFTYAWTGPANASASVQRGVGVAQVGAGFPERAARIQSTEWAKSGTKSIRVIPFTNISYAEVSVVGLTVGQAYTLICTVRRVVPGVGTAHPDARKFVVVGSSAPTVTMLATPPNAAGEYEMRGVFVAEETTYGVRIMNGYSVGDCWFDDFAVVPCASIAEPYTGPFFDGSTPDGDYNYAWTGTANASTSTAQATALTAGTAANAVAYRSSQWSAQGGFCAAIMPTGTSDASNLFIPASSLGMLPNTSYTIMATARLGAAQTGTLNAMARRMVITAGLTDPVVAPVIPDNAPGVYELRATLTTGATLGASDGVTLWNGASSGGGIIYWDNLAVIPVPSESQDYLYDYFDGSTPDVPGRIYTWSSTPDASISSAFGTLAGSTIGTVVSDLDKPLSFVVENLTPGKTYDIQVRATSAYGVQGILSDILTIAMPPAPEVALEPSTPIVDTRLGVVTTYWDGLLGEAIPLPGFLYVFAEFTREGTEDWAQFGPQLRKAGSVTLTSEPVGSTVHVRLRSVDNLGNVSAPSAEQEVIVVGVTGPDIEANSVTANHIEAGSISVTHLEPSVGQTLDISANDAVVIIAGGLDATNSNLEEMQTVYSFTPTEAVISSPESNFTLALDSDSIEIREGGVPVSWWNAGQMHVPSFVGDTVILGNHQLEKFGTGTVMRAL